MILEGFKRTLPINYEDRLVILDEIHLYVKSKIRDDLV